MGKVADANLIVRNGEQAALEAAKSSSKFKRSTGRNLWSREVITRKMFTERCSFELGG
jgi:hypothetical protein